MKEDRVKEDNVCRVCKKEFEYQLPQSGICHSCDMGHATLNKNCKKCETIIVSENQNAEYCHTCERSSSKEKKWFTILVGTLATVVGGLFYYFSEKDS